MGEDDVNPTTKLSKADERKLATYKIKRDGVKTELSVLKATIEGTFESPELALDFMKDTLVGIKELKTQFEDTQLQIELLTTNTADINERTEYTKLHENIRKQLLIYIRQYDNKTANSIDTTTSTSTNSGSGGHLPQLKLPKFSGRYEEWSSYEDSFMSMVGNHQTISNVDKFNYLKSTLFGDALQRVNTLKVTDANYERAWAILKDKYDNKRLIMQGHIAAIFNLPSCKDRNGSLQNLAAGAIENINALQGLGLDTTSWDLLLIHILTSKLDATTLDEWEDSIMGNDLPTYDKLIKFIEHKGRPNRFTTNTQVSKPIINTTNRQISTNTYKCNNQHNYNLRAHYVSKTNEQCTFCNDNHSIYRCKQFKDLTVEQRLNHVRKQRLCYNCLLANHQTKDCYSQGCFECNKRHHTMIHLNHSTTAQCEQTNTPPSTTSLTTNMDTNGRREIILSTAICYVQDMNNDHHECRVLLDSGSQANFITTKLAEILQLPLRNDNCTIRGIANHSTKNLQLTTIHLTSNDKRFKQNLNCYVLEQITGDLPTVSLARSDFKIPHNITLADKNFNISRQIDMLIGAELFFDLLLTGEIKLGDNLPTIKHTKLGWIVSGVYHKQQASNKLRMPNCLVSTLEQKVEQFWTIEDCTTQQRTLNHDEKLCEEHFQRNVQRDKSGRFIVRLPFIENYTALGESRHKALNRLFQMEKRFNRDANFKKSYADFMDEYVKLGHMKEVTTKCTDEHFYLPHHAVTKADSVTTKLRVVFDGSCKTTTGVSLNNNLLIGPTLQDDLMSILLRFRTHKYAITADITKMYRQINIDERDTKFQRILWRNDQTEPIREYELTTVTYGTACASYLAIKSLQQLAQDHSTQYPLASSITMRDFYVDDLITGTDTLDELHELIRQLNLLMAEGGFELRKWASNNCDITKGLDNTLLQFQTTENVSTLGLVWSRCLDTFQYKRPNWNQYKRPTKRSVLATIAGMFDPIGLIGPIIVNAKIFLQDLWLQKLHWDESLPNKLLTTWNKFTNELNNLHKISVQRNLSDTIINDKNFDLHGFADASERAYGACIYLKTNSTCTLLCAKSRVAPVKQITIPRLELCAAVLLVNLMNKVTSALNKTPRTIKYWTDSTITLSWIKCSSKQLKVFVAHRVSEIQTQTNISDWNHVGSTNNPADILSRGADVKTLLNNELWWHGPKWLLNDNFPQQPTILRMDMLPEIKQNIAVNVATTSQTVTIDFIKNTSCWTKLVRLTAWINRFLNNCRKPKTERICLKYINTIELVNARNQLTRICQHERFHSEIKRLSDKKDIAKSILLRLNPCLDKHGLLRVNGRLKFANLSPDERYPIILPSDHRITQLIIRHHHLVHYHSGVQLTLAAVRQTYWVIGGRNTVKRVLRKCVQCFRCKPNMQSTIMGVLPEPRVNPARAFLNCGVDLCGPINIKEGPKRSKRTYKAYIAVFICLATKAIHLELVTNLTTEAFIATLRRVMARRGNILNIYSDNATNFVGASRELKRFKEIVEDNDFLDKLNNININWNFIPPRSPHMGGLWEAGVKSVKTHLTKTYKDNTMTYEEVYTLLVQIEAILNSRPLTKLTDDVDDLEYLTPGHFLIGAPLTEPADPDLMHLRENRLSLYQKTQQRKQVFWKRWSKEYLQQLQRRTGCFKDEYNINVGTIVLICEDNTPPLHWPLGRVIKTFPGCDGIVRVVEIQTKKGVYRRAVAKLAVLPIKDNY